MSLTRIETLEDRRQFAATVGVDPTFGTVSTLVAVNADTRPLCAVALPGGRLLVAGIASQTNATNIEHNVFALYSPTGHLISSFNKHHVLVQDAATTNAFGGVSAMTALPDGSVLVETRSGVHRLRMDGTFDPDFGNGGVLPKHAASAVVLPDGTIQAIQTTMSVEVTNGLGRQVYHSRVFTFTDEGRYLSGTDMIVGRVQRLPDGRLYAESDAGVGTFYNADLQPDPTFGTSGSVYLQAAAERWAIKHGPWYAGTRDVSTSPTVQVDASWQNAEPIPLVGGGYAISFDVDADHAPNDRESFTVGRYIRLNAQGGIVAVGVTADTFQAAGTAFNPANTLDRHRTFQSGSGGPVSFTLPWNQYDQLVTARAADGSYYLADMAFVQNGTGFEITHTQPVVGTISGVLFGDTNSNGQQDPNEATAAAGKVVYLDTNDNGKLDLGEAWTTTDADGHYAFDDLGPGQYVVRRVLPKGYALTRPALPQTLAVGQTLTVPIGSIAA